MFHRSLSFLAEPQAKPLGKRSAAAMLLLLLFGAAYMQHLVFSLVLMLILSMSEKNG
jgi:hypothetical protein